MKVVLDTSVLVRFFTDDLPNLADKVEQLLENEQNLLIPDAVFPELEYILVQKYSMPRSKIITIFKFLSAHTNIKLPPHVHQAIQLFIETRLDMADCIIAAYSLKGKLASFDKELLTVKSVSPYWK